MICVQLRSVVCHGIIHFLVLYVFYYTIDLFYPMVYVGLLLLNFDLFYPMLYVLTLNFD